MITIDTLDDFETSDQNLQLQANLLFEAINNWNNEVNSVEDYINEITFFLGGSLEITKWQIENILNKKSIIYESWKIESVSVLLGLYNQINSNVSLKTILEKLLFDIKKNSNNSIL